MPKIKPFCMSLGLAAALSLGACSNQPDDNTTGDPQTHSQQEQGPDYGLNHDDIIGNVGDIFIDGRQVPPAEGEKLHSCGKLRFSTFTNILASRGANTTVQDMVAKNTAYLLSRAQPVWGVANYPARVGESIRNTTSSLVNLQDIVLAMAEDLVTTTNPDGAWMTGPCMGAKLFDTTGMTSTCNRDGFACLLGVAMTMKQAGLCDNMVADASTGIMDPLIRKHLTVAALTGTNYLCD